MRGDKQVLTFSKDAGRGLAAVDVVSASSIELQRRIGCGSGYSKIPPRFCIPVDAKIPVDAST